jgi:small subunit ribosomal protein S20
MPNIKSAKKRVRIIEKKTAQNTAIKSQFKTAIKKFEEACEAGSADAKELLAAAKKALDKAATKGIITKQTAARRKSRLDLRLAKGSAKKVAEEKPAKKTAAKKTTTAKKTTAKKTTKKAEKVEE